MQGTWTLHQPHSYRTTLWIVRQERVRWAVDVVTQCTWNSPEAYGYESNQGATSLWICWTRHPKNKPECSTIVLQIGAYL